MKIESLLAILLLVLFATMASGQGSKPPHKKEKPR